jgi:hypothetical protein
MNQELVQDFTKLFYVLRHSGALFDVNTMAHEGVMLILVKALTGGISEILLGLRT